MAIPHEAPSKNEGTLLRAIANDTPIPTVANSNEVSMIVLDDLGKTTRLTTL
jgi:hypothetical protein